MLHLPNDWAILLQGEMKKDYLHLLCVFLTAEYQNNTIYPPKDEILSAFELTPYHNVKVVILGQDPYHQQGQAHGLAFSVKDDTSIPPSLRNIYKEIKETRGQDAPKSGDLTHWARQGVLLLNTVLTVRDSEAGSHRGKGWEEFTDCVISLLNQREEAVIFMLWGADAKKKESLVTNKQHIILTAAHPSPLSAYRGFFGCNHFNKANTILKDMGKSEIIW
ncbi:MAG: uracil-DNA glycosylase [Oscillospiraceae bacterium]